MEHDILGKALDIAVDTVLKVRDSLNIQVPAGPNKLSVTKPELLQQLQKMSAEGKLQTAQNMGVDNFLDAVNGSGNGNGSKSIQAIQNEDDLSRR